MVKTYKLKKWSRRQVISFSFGFRSIFSHLIVMITIVPCLVGCESFKFRGRTSWSTLQLDSPQFVKLHAIEGEVRKTRYFSSVRSTNYESDQMTRDKMEEVEFTVEARFRQVDLERGLIFFVSETIQKDGTASLHDLALPELGEVIEFVMTPGGQVRKAGNFPTYSLFYVPPVPLPQKPVSPGDTWELSHSWLSSGNLVPMELHVVGILKRFVDCGEFSPCAEIEMSGQVRLADEVEKSLNQPVRFKSEIWGVLLYSVKLGELLWSEVQNKEDLVTAGSRMEARSCLVSLLEGFQKRKISCEPTGEAVTKLNL